jgi:hypothetical protein
MKTMSLVLMSVLIGGASAWAYGPYCGPVPRCGAPVVNVGCYPVPRAVYAAPVVYAMPVMYTPPRMVYVQPAPVIYAQPVVYARPVCCVSPVVEAIVALPFLLGGHHGGGHHR